MQKRKKKHSDYCLSIFSADAKFKKSAS